MSGYIYKRGKARNKWSLVIPITNEKGERKLKWISFTGKKKEAQEELNNLVNDRNNGVNLNPAKVTVSEYLDIWLKIGPDVSDKTLERYKEIVDKHIKPAIGEIPLQKLTLLHIQNYYTDAQKSGRLDNKGGLSKRTIVHIHRVLNGALKYAVSFEYIPRNPLDKFTKQQKPKATNKKVVPLEALELSSLLDAASSTQFHMEILLAATTGMRRGEVYGLRWKDIKFDKCSLTVNKTLEKTKKKLQLKTPKTETSIRIIALPQMTINALRKHRVEQKKTRLLIGPGYQDNDLVFANVDGTLKNPDTFTAGFKRIARSIDMPHVRLHDLRHTHASQLIEEGINIKVISERLGHSTASFTLDVYGHLMKGSQEKAANAIDALLGPSFKSC